MAREDTDRFRELFLNDLPLLDTRAPVEFAQGAFPTAVNQPLMNDEERHQVGLCYKQRGQDAAIKLGHELVSGDLKSERLRQWCEFARANPQGYLYCFRGGLRSRTARQWMRDAGVDYPLVEGGYKAMRRFLIDELQSFSARIPLLLVAGKTGTGKTRVIEALQRALDLEGLAHHRGSTFGQLLDPQPAQIDFENTLAIQCLKLSEQGCSPVIVEDEGRMVGRVNVPQCFREAMQRAPLLVIEEPVESRVQVILEDYVLDLGGRYERRYGTQGPESGPVLHQQKLEADLLKIRKRLGGLAHQQVLELMQQAFAVSHNDGGVEAHRLWIERLLVDYYDPMYEYQMSRREGDVSGRGDRTAVLAQAAALSEPSH